MQYISKCALLNFLKEKRTKLKFLKVEVCEGLFSSQKCLTPLGEGVCNSENIQPNLPSERSLRSLPVDFSHPGTHCKTFECKLGLSS